MFCHLAPLLPLPRPFSINLRPNWPPLPPLPAIHPHHLQAVFTGMAHPKSSIQMPTPTFDSFKMPSQWPFSPVSIDGVANCFGWQLFASSVFAAKAKRAAKMINNLVRTTNNPQIGHKHSKMSAKVLFKRVKEEDAKHCTNWKCRWIKGEWHIRMNPLWVDTCSFFFLYLIMREYCLKVIQLMSKKFRSLGGYGLG